MAFIYRPENGVTLSPSQAEFLESIENKPSPFQGLTSLKDLRSLTGLSVVVTDRERLREILFNAKEATYSKIAEDHRASNLAEKDIHDRQIWIEEHLNPEKSRFILGLYSRKLFWFDGDAPKVYLFADNIEACASKKGYSEEHVFGFVFIHEMMHAYYDAFNSAGFPAKEPLEEAFAEYGMLTFINKTIGPGVFLEEAKASVFSKIDYGPREYGFGYELFADTSGGAPEMIERYRLVSNWIAGLRRITSSASRIIKKAQTKKLRQTALKGSGIYWSMNGRSRMRDTLYNRELERRSRHYLRPAFRQQFPRLA